MVGTPGSRIRMAEFYTLLDAILTIWKYFFHESSYGMKTMLFSLGNIILKEKGGNERVTGRKAKGLQMVARLQVSDIFYLSLKWQEETNYSCQIFCFPDSSVGKESPCNAGAPGSIPPLGNK